MNVHPIIAALRRQKVAALLIVLQIALTLTIVANAFFIIGNTIEDMIRPTGVEEDGLICVVQGLTGISGSDAAVIEKIDALERADLQAIRNQPDVLEVAASMQGGNVGVISLDADRKGKLLHADYFYGDEHLQSTLGVHLIAGRDFFSSEIRHGHALPDLPVVIVSKPLADQLFPNGNALGQTIFQDGNAATIVGIVGPLQSSGDGNPDYYSVIEPKRVDAFWPKYYARARPGRTASALREIHTALFALNPIRQMPRGAGIYTFAEEQARGTRDERGIAILMAVICAILLSVTAAGIVGLTSFWVSQRHRQIGVRRALGAKKIDILRYFQIENLLIVGCGSTLGVLCAFGLNGWLMKHYEMTHLPLFYVAIGALVMLLLGQAAVLMPARRASKVPPIVATRSV
ncbi:ABC transporter permease [Rhodanobacter umsongensis]|uniref:ABC transporter permease n=1 Tax=Rhodanobacter umsongensis TaxID=633153 RepID=A0ABW0JHY1_9GAMM